MLQGCHIKEGFSGTMERKKGAARRRLGSALLLALLAGGAAAGAQTCVPSSNAPKNIVFILFDDMGYGTLGSYGGNTIDTKELDDFTTQAKKFNQFYVNAPVCSPARVSILTGDDPQRFNVRTALAHGGFSTRFMSSKVGIPEYALTLPEMLQNQCFRTVHLGKWHVGLTKNEFTPTGVGFDEWAIRLPGEVNSRKCGHYWDDMIERHDGTKFSTCSQLPDPPGGHLARGLLGDERG